MRQGLGSLSRRSTLVALADSEYLNEHITFEDIDIYDGIISGLNNYLTSYQKLSADINADGTIDQYDLRALQLILSDTSLVYGDISGDGIVNVVDIVSVVNYILSSDNPTLDQLIAADFNDDGIINVVDIVTLVSLILDT